MRLIVIGGGIAGLAAALRARQRADEAGLSLDITVIEASDRLGGKILTQEGEGGVPLELGPDSLLATKPRGRELAAELGLADDLVAPGPQARRAYLLLGGQLKPLPDGLAMGVPTGLGPLVACLRGGIIGPAGALRAGIEPLLPRTGSPGNDLSVAEFTRRRLGTQVSQRLIAPLVTGVFGADPAEISMQSALPQFASARSLVLAMARRPKPPAGKPGGGGGSPFLSIRGGMSRLVDAATVALKRSPDAGGGQTEILLNTPATRLAIEGREFLVDAAGGRLRARAVLVAAPATVAAQLLREVAPEAATTAGGIRYHASAVALLRYRPGDVGRALDGSGYLAAPEESAVVAAGTWLTTKWPHIDWTDTWVRAVVVSPEALDRSDDDLEGAVVEETSRILEAKTGPLEVRLHRWPEALPVYAPGHRVLVEEVMKALPPGVELAGAACRGLGVPDCISGGETAAETLVSSIVNTL